MRPPANVCSACGQAYDPSALFCPKDGTPLGAAAIHAGPDPYLGVEIAGPIRIEQLIGVGTMGRVYRGFQQGVERNVAVKILHRELMGSETIVARFQREARAASRVVHPNVVEVLMKGALPDGGPHYMVLEHLDGITLRSALAAAGGAFPLGRALSIALSICDAIGEAHAQGIVHRDLKPENIMLVRRGAHRDFVKVLDFGLARIAKGGEPAMTQAGVIFGTARYISPEGAAGRPVGPAGDVYSIATIAYELLTGRPPFDGDSPTELLVRRTTEDAPPLPRKSAPAPIAAIIGESLDRRPEARAPDARAFGIALVRAARESGLAGDDFPGLSTLLGGGKADGAVPTLPLGSADAAPRDLGSADAAPRALGSTDVAARTEATQRPAVHASGASRRRRDAPVPRTRLALLIATCFLAGAALAVASAWRFGLHKFAVPDEPAQTALDAGSARGANTP
jgi:serine/threonine-protein kinase